MNLVLFHLLYPNEVQFVQNNWRKQKPLIFSKSFFVQTYTLALVAACGNKPRIALKFDIPQEVFWNLIYF